MNGKQILERNSHEIRGDIGWEGTGSIENAVNG